MIDVVDRVQRGVAEQRREAGKRSLPAFRGWQPVERPRVGETQQDARSFVAGTDVERDEDGPLVGECLARVPVRTPERCLVSRVGLAQVALRPVLGELAVFGRQVRHKGDAAAVLRRDRDDDGLRVDRPAIRRNGECAVGVPLYAAHHRVEHHA